MAWHHRTVLPATDLKANGRGASGPSQWQGPKLLNLSSLILKHNSPDDPQGRLPLTRLLCGFLTTGWPVNCDPPALASPVGDYRSVPQGPAHKIFQLLVFLLKSDRTKM